MENNKLTYQTARRLRGEKLRDIFADQLIMGEGYGAGIKNAVSLKLRAKLTGIKEKFDPLNIAKFLTFGSRLGPAILGKMTGRSRRDIEYFTGRARPVTSRETKVGMMQQMGLGGGSSAGMQVVLNDILTFLQKSHEDDMVLREKENNLREGAKLEDEKRHKKLLKALEGSGKQTATPVKEKKDTGGGFFDKFRQMIDDIKESLNGLWDNFTEKLGTIFKELGALKNIISTVLSTVGRLASAAGIPFLIGAAPIAVLGLAAWMAAPAEGGGNTENQTKVMEKIQEVSGFKRITSDVVPEDDMEGRPGFFSGKSATAYDARKKRIEKSFELGTQYSPEDVERIKKAYQITVPPQNVETATPQTKVETEPEPVDTKKQDATGRANAANDPRVKAALPAVEQKATPVTTPASAAVSMKTDENVKLSMEATVAPKTETTQKTTNNYAHSSQEQIRAPSIPAVRNLEPSFQEMIWGSTRVI